MRKVVSIRMKAKIFSENPTTERANISSAEESMVRMSIKIGIDSPIPRNTRLIVVERSVLISEHHFTGIRKC